MTTTIIINEQHSLLPSQSALLPEGFLTVKVPADGWDQYEMDDIMYGLNGDVVFVSPIPYMMARLMYSCGANHFQAACQGAENCQGGTYPRVTDCSVMCNDNREKKELPGGKIISVTAKEGWYLS